MWTPAHTSQCPVDPDCPANVCTDPQCGACLEHLEDHAEGRVDIPEDPGCVAHGSTTCPCEDEPDDWWDAMPTVEV